MSNVALGDRTASSVSPSVRFGLAGMAILLAVLAVPIRAYAPILSDYPDALVVPLSDWISALFNALPGLPLGFFTFGDLMAGVRWLIQQPLDLTEVVLYRGIPAWGIGPLPWVAVVVMAGLVGWRAGGLRLAALGAGGMLYLAVFGLWELSMQTLALVVVTVPLICAAGLVLGILAADRPRLEAILNPVFDVLQSTPQIAYLVPVVVLFGLGEVAAVVATTVFAVPAMARCVVVGLKTVAPEVVEAGLMAGATPRQLLWKVRLPAAQPTILVGVNQAIMLTLAMVVIASLIGAQGLGHQILIQLDRLWLGRALEVGMGIVVLAIVLDKLSRGLISRPRVHQLHVPWHRNRSTWIVTGLIAAAFALGAVDQRFAVPQPEMAISTADFWDGLIKWVTDTWFYTLRAFRNAALIYFLLPIKNFLLWLPWTVVIGAVVLGGYAVGGFRLAVTAGLIALFPAVTGLWVPTMTTVYMIGTALIVCLVIGLPIGVLAARSDRISRVVMPVCDLLQTLPSFVYLVPVVMLFQVGDVAAISATIAYAVVPIIRYTNLGLRNVSSETKEAAVASGCSGWQVLVKVELPMALPEILLGVNQMIVFGLFTLSITALVGARDLSATIYRALSEIDPGQGIVGGICIACLAILSDRFIRAWTERRRRSVRA